MVSSRVSSLLAAIDVASHRPDEEVSFKKAKAAAKKAGNEEPDDFLQIKKGASLPTALSRFVLTCSHSEAGPLFSFGFFRVILDEARTSLPQKYIVVRY
jgi:hypothetical protein